MKQKYHTPIIEEFAAESATLFAASGNNEDFGNKPGTYDLLDPRNFFDPSTF
ncbi:MAG: hypothetical protein IKX03_00510 [Bacteroidales bacterium]|nr:hypothetical protein [Bacteroidales bacterium]MBR5055655.1 hypothetical protein [Bacteroidales bacterium]